MYLDLDLLCLTSADLCWHLYGLSELPLEQRLLMVVDLTLYQYSRTRIKYGSSFP